MPDSNKYENVDPGSKNVNPADFYLLTKINPPILSAKNIKDVVVISENDRCKVMILTTPVEDLLPADILLALKSCGLRPSKFRMFKWQPNVACEWHRDGTTQGTMNFTLNWVLSGSGEMQWNNNINVYDYGGKYQSTLAAGILPKVIRSSGPDDEYEIAVSGHKCLVNSGIPHRLITGDKGRVTLGLLWDDHAFQYSFKDAAERLKSVDLIDTHY